MTLTLCIIVSWSRGGVIFLALSHSLCLLFSPVQTQLTLIVRCWGPGPPPPKSGVPTPRVRVYPLPRARNNVHPVCSRPCFMSTSVQYFYESERFYVYVFAACPWCIFISILHAHDACSFYAACPWCMSMLHVYAEYPCCMYILLLHHACPLCMAILIPILHDHVLCRCLHTAWPWCISKLLAAFRSCMLMHTHTACPWWMPML